MRSEWSIQKIQFFVWFIKSFIHISMQDISLFPEWNREEVIQVLERNPLDHKTMKNKLDRIYQISFTNQLEYVPDVLDAYCWIRLAHETDDFKKFFPSQRNEKQFYQEFVATAIRYMVICKRFKNKVMMVLTQQMMIEGLKLFKKKFDLLQKFLKMVSILNCTFDHDKQFYKINYTVESVQKTTIYKSIADVNFDDSNDEKNDPQMKERFILRGDICSSQLYLDLLNYAHKELDLFNMLLQAVVNKKFNIEGTSEIVSFLMTIHPFFHRKWALQYIPALTQGIIDYVNKGDDITIRNFSKERYEAVITSVREFLKRVTTVQERKLIVEEFQLNLICRFLFSDFLDRKLQAISILTTFMKYSKNSLVKSKEEFVEWIKEKQILKAIYNDKSHEEFISRSSEFLQYYLLQKPSVEELSPLLQLTDANIKLISEIFQYFPKQFQNEVVNKIKEKENVTNKEALNIIKQTPGCEEWLLKNGGQCWVQVMRQKPKKKTDIAQVFNQDFKVVKKITKEISELFEGKFKTEFFLYMNEINYVSTVLQNNNIPLEERLRYVALALEPLSQINETTYQAILPFTTKTVDSLPDDLLKFFVNLLDKLTRSHLRDLFKRNFSQKESLSQMGMGQMSIFKKCFLLINEQEKNIQKKITFSYITPHSYRKEKKQHLKIKVNPNNLNGMTQLMTIIFENKNISVSQQALQFIGFLFDRLDEALVHLVSEFKSKILDSCLQEFYKTEDQQEKYLKIIEKLMNESQKDGIDKTPSVDSLFPVEMITIKIIDHFNVNKCKITMEVSSNLSLYELRVHIGRTINAYVHEMKISLNDQQIDPRLNGHIIHNINLFGDLIVEKKVNIDKVPLCNPDGGLNDKAKKVLSGMFKQYSTIGLMSKAQCQKYQQRCIGEITSMSQSRVDKIYEQYDTDKDGYLTEADFLKFYEVSAASKQSAVWSNLETFGVRNDLQILNEQEIQYPDGELLTRNLLYKNETFVNKLILMIQSLDESQAKAAWKIISRLPLIKRPLDEFKIDSKYSFRYWLYLVEDSQQYHLVTKEILRKALQSDIETACIGLKIAHECTEFDVEIFNIIIKNMKKIVSQESYLSFYNKVLLDNSLKLFESCLRLNLQIKNQFLEKEPEYRESLTSGLMSNNHEIRTMFCKTIEELITETYSSDFEIFQVFFNLIYKNFEKCDKSTLSIEYFDLYSNLLQVLQNNPDLYEKLKLNEQMLAKSMVDLYKEHRCTQTGLNSKPDHVSQGFLRIIGKLLNKQTQEIMIPFVGYLFQNSLFPEHGQNKLKNSKTRKDAYELLYEICSLKNEKGDSLGLSQLFDAGFKSVYKKMNQNKPTTMSFSYYYNYNEARSQLGYAGIRNLGCICYMIAMLQQLFMTKAFRYLILMADDKEPENLVRKGTKQIDDNIFHQLKNMFANLELTEKQQYNPDEFCFAFKDFEGQPINVTIQQDAQQFINLFFDKMEQSLKRTPFRRIFSDIYGGKNCNLTVCSNCGVANERYENFYPLSLEIKGHKSIEASFQKYITGEVISDYQCDSCKKKTDVTKSCYLASTPNYFIIHLTRMCFNYDKFENEKVNSRWEFPHKLNLWEYSLDKLKGIQSKQQFDYQLKGIVLHYGTADFGHYFSYIKESQNQWIQFNDERVRQYDPRDIQSDCFGGQNWRRESQSAYLLVYEKVQKRPIILEFETEEQKESALTQFGLKKAIIENEIKLQKKEELLEEDEKQKESETQISTKPLQAQKPKILVNLDPSKIPAFVPENLRQKISKANEQFSFSLNLSNDEFAYFLYKILSIQPPDELTTEYLELCYECFHLKQVVQQSTEQGNSLTLSEWAAKRFKEIVKGHGWQFLKNFGKNWQSDILSIEKSTRVGIKNLLQCVISDIINSNDLNNELDQTEKTSEEGQQLVAEKREIILQFLQKYTDMMSNEVTKHWHRFKEYFEVWLSLVENNSFVRRYCEQNMMIEKILDFILEDESPFTRTKKKYSMGNNYYSAEFEYPLEFMTLLIKHGYELNDMENRCMKYYAFMSKVINFQTKYFNIVQYLCKEDQVLSQKMAFLILHEASRVNQSDGIKPVVNIIHKYLEIDDHLKQKRKEWILGIPQYIENSKTSSYGQWNVNIDQEYILSFYSPVRAQPILLQLMRFKNKTQHVAALLLSILLQLQSDGVITSLQEFPALQAFEKTYTHWFGDFVDNYYEETHRPYMAKNYVEYGNRLKNLWNERPHRQYEKLPYYLIGKTQQKNLVFTEIIQDMIELKVQDVTSELLEITPQNSFLNKKNIKNFEGSENFRVKAPYHSNSTFLPIDRDLQSSDQSDGEQKKVQVNPFDKKISAVLFRKCTIKNFSNENLLLTFKVTEQGEKNTVIPQSAVSFDIRSESSYAISLYKKDVEKDFGELKYLVNILGKATRQGYWPRQIITPVVEEDKAPAAPNAKVGSDDESGEDFP